MCRSRFEIVSLIVSSHFNQMIVKTKAINLSCAHEKKDLNFSEQRYGSNAAADSAALVSFKLCL